MTIVMVFVSLSYKQSVLSFILFMPVSAMALFPINDATPLHLLRVSTLIIIVVEYLITVTNLSSYNSPANFPKELLHSNYEGQDDEFLGVYPNKAHHYMNIPWFFELAKT